MAEVYNLIWKLAKEYYKKGRPGDVKHIEWMMKDALLVCKKEHIDDSLLLPLVILHDVGYAEVPRENPFKLDIRKLHMNAGAKIAEKVLQEVKYPKDKIKKIAYYVSIHDNWALGDNKIYNEDRILGIFNDLDFIWMSTKNGFPILMKILNKNREEMIDYLESDEKPRKRPFSTETTKKLFEKYLGVRKNEKQ